MHASDWLVWFVVHTSGPCAAVVGCGCGGCGYGRNGVFSWLCFRTRTLTPGVALRVCVAEVWAFYKKAMASFWTVEEVDLAHDMKVRAWGCCGGASPWSM